MSFTQFKFKKYIEEALEELKFTTPTEVQEKLIPIVLAGRDLVGESKTGYRGRLIPSCFPFSNSWMKRAIACRQLSQLQVVN